ncbi:MAG: saccharopine dehydrogenase NADP-binding domain-containing protein [Dehalococcoidales bacterium]|nr:saccharopine dehydrogenase NADP-binding domain-containing protein [Dehalococcoidales bacterium]
MKILIVGIGPQGMTMTRLLAKEPVVTNVICASRNSENLKRFSERLNSKKVSTICVDATKPHEVIEAAKGVDIVVNTCQAFEPVYSNILDAAFENEAHYLDFCYCFNNNFPPLPMHRWELFEQSDKWKFAGLTAITGVGKSPGTAEILAMNSADKLDRVDEIRQRDFYETISQTPPSVWWDMGIRAAQLWSPIVYDDGECKIVPFGEEEEYPFPNLGLRKVSLIALPSVEAAPHFIGKGLRHLDCKFGKSGPGIEMYRQMGFLSDKPIDIKGVKVAPLDVIDTISPPITPSWDEYENQIKTGIITDSAWVTVVEVTGARAGVDVKHKSHVFIPLHDVAERLPGTNVIMYETSAAGATFIKMLSAGEIQTKGMITCYQLSIEERELFLSKLASEKGVVIAESIERSYRQHGLRE